MINKSSLVKAAAAINVVLVSIAAVSAAITSPVKAQETPSCYIVDRSGLVTDLSSICNASRNITRENANEPTNTNLSTRTQQNQSPQERSFSSETVTPRVFLLAPGCTTILQTETVGRVSSSVE